MMIMVSKFLPTKGFNEVVGITANMVLVCLVICSSLLGMPALSSPVWACWCISRSGVMCWLWVCEFFMLPLALPLMMMIFIEHSLPCWWCMRITWYCIMLTHIQHFIWYTCPVPFQLYQCTWDWLFFITCPSWTSQPDGAHSAGSPGRQAWVCQLVHSHHGRVGCELVCHCFRVCLPFLPQCNFASLTIQLFYH